MSKHLYILILSWLLIPLSAFPQSYIPSTSVYTVQDGLSSNEIHAIRKGPEGFIWIGTQYGLNRFDGREFKILTKENGSGLEFNAIHKIMEDGSGYLWLAKTNEKYEHLFTSVEINLLHPQSGAIVSFEEHFGESAPFSMSDISFINQLSDQSIFINCEKIGKNFRYHSSTGFRSISFPEKVETIQSVLLKDNGNMLVVAFSGNTGFNLFEISPSGKMIQQGTTTMEWIVHDGGQSYALSTWGNLNLEAFLHLPLEFGTLAPSPAPLGTDIIQTRYNPDERLFWLKKNERLFVAKPDGEIIYKYDNINESTGELAILFDGTTTWFSNKKDGLVVVNLEPNHFKTFQFFKKTFDNSMRGMAEDKTGTLWFSSIHGMGTMDREGRVSIINTNNFFTPFGEDGKGNIWYHNQHSSSGKESFLVRYDPITGQKTDFPVTIPHFHWVLFHADNGEVWYNTGKGEFYALNPNTGETYQKADFPHNEKMDFNIYHFQKKDAESVWVCSNQGLFIIDWNGGILANFNAKNTGKAYLPAKDIHHLYQGDGGEIWVATGDAGLFKLKEDKDGSFSIEKQYTTQNGLSSNSLHAVYADTFDYLWISSDDGLMQLDRRNGQITKYFQSNGIIHDEFNRIAHCRGKDGKLYFGGIHGITAFDPKDFADSRNKKQAPILAIADYQQFSGDKKEFENLTASLRQTRKITLRPNDRFFKLKLALLDFKNRQNSIYQYRIKGLYDWQSTANNELNINSLPYGNHSLEIKAQNSDLQPSANTLDISIKVLRPFYYRWWFVGASFCLVLLGIWAFLRRRSNRISIEREAEQLRDLDRMKSRFFANISHELRTPLTLIGLPLEYLLKNLDETSKGEIKQYLQAAYYNKEDLNRLINEILDLSKLESGKLELEHRVVILQHFISKVVYAFKASAETKGIDLRFSSSISGRTIVRLDVAKLELIINNLLSNALKFTSENGVISVHAAWENERELHVKIQDTGRGIPPEDLPHVFKRYFQSKQKNTKLEGGSGIGLAICKEFIELMGGKIHADSILGEGSTFSFHLPLKTADGEAPPAPEESHEELARALPFKAQDQPLQTDRATILIVEDHPELRQHLQLILSKEYNILTAGNGLEALQILEKNSPQLILSDIMMPKMDGFTFLERVKAHDEWCGIPFILLTARADIEDKLQGLRIGVDAYMTKPFEAEELSLRVRNLLANAQNRRAEPPAEVGTGGKDEAPNTAQAPPSYQPTKEDIAWLKQIETIALREIKNRQFTMEDLSSELLMGHRSMQRKIKQITGLTPNRYIRSIRLHKARQLLETRKASTLKEVAFEVGFEGLTHFRKLFEAEFGKRPQDYLK